MNPNLENQGNIRKYEKPMTKKHEAMNTVQGSMLYYTSLYSTSLYSLYRVTLYYYH
jgi:hypothetical protein